MQDTNDSHFNIPPFDTQDGLEIGELIKKMIRPDPEQRISLMEVFLALQNIQAKIIKRRGLRILEKIRTTCIGINDEIMQVFITKNHHEINSITTITALQNAQDKLATSLECLMLLNKIRPLGFGKHDTAMHEFIFKKYQEILGTTNPEALQVIRQELVNTLTDLTNHPLQEESTRKMITSAHTNEDYFTDSLKQESAKIKHDIYKISIADRRSEMSGVMDRIANLQQKVSNNQILKEKEACNIILKDIATHALNKNDTGMEKFLAEKNIEIQRMDNITSLLALKDTLGEVLKSLNIPQLTQLKALNNLDQAQRHSPGMVSKITKITQAVSEIPVPDRYKIDTTSTIISDIESIPKHQDKLQLCVELLKEINDTRVNADDWKMDNYIRYQARQISNAQDLDHLDTVHNELLNTLQNLKAIMDTVKVIITNFRKRAKESNSIGMAHKASKIEQALLSVPIEERKTIMNIPEINSSLPTQSAYEVQRELASHRILTIKNKYLPKEPHSISAKKAATSFKQFKDKMEEIVNKNKKNVGPDKGHSLP